MYVCTYVCVCVVHTSPPRTAAVLVHACTTHRCGLAGGGARKTTRPDRVAISLGILANHFAASAGFAVDPKSRQPGPFKSRPTVSRIIRDWNFFFFFCSCALPPRCVPGSLPGASQRATWEPRDGSGTHTDPADLHTRMMGPPHFRLIRRALGVLLQCALLGMPVVSGGLCTSCACNTELEGGSRGDRETKKGKKKINWICSA